MTHCSQPSSLGGSGSGQTQIWHLDHRWMPVPVSLESMTPFHKDHPHCDRGALVT